jgi:hypothetical protein
VPLPGQRGFFSSKSSSKPKDNPVDELTTSIVGIDFPNDDRSKVTGA